MGSTENYRYTEFDGLKAIEIPYQDRRTSMVVIVPKREEGEEIAPIEKITKGMDYKILGSILGTLSRSKSSRVRLTLPKFEFSYKRELSKDLRAQGLENLFTSSANFSGLSQSGSFKVGLLLQKTYIKVAEEGTEAAAVTSIGLEATSVPVRPDVTMTVDQPFLFVIYDKPTSAIHFVGTVKEPS